MKTKKIDKFIINKASYFVENEKFKVLLNIYYWENRFEIEKNPELVDSNFDDEFISEVEEIAKDLLLKKSKVNFVER